MESGFCFCSANASRMAWNIAAVHSFSRLFPVVNVFLNIPQDSKETHF